MVGIARRGEVVRGGVTGKDVGEDVSVEPLAVWS